MRILSTGLAILLCAASAAAATRKVPQQYETIQAACDAAVDGDTILVSKKPDGSPYQEWVEAYKSLKFVGKNVVWDGHRFAENGGGYGTCLYVSTEGGEGIVVRGFRFRNGSSHVTVYGENAVIRNCTFSNAYGGSVQVYGNGTVLRNCTFVGNQRCADLYGSDIQVLKNTGHGHSSGGFFVYGNDGSVHHNRLDRSGENDAVYVDGNGAHVFENVITDSYTGVYVTGNEGLVEKNRVSRVEGESTGIYVYGTFHTVSKNTLSRFTGYGIYANGSGGSEDGDNNVVVNNVLRWAGDDGIYLYGTSSTVEGNKVSVCGESGIYAGDSGAYDSKNRVVGNTVSDTFGNGIYVSGGGHTVAENVISDSDSYGIYASTPSGAVENVIRENVIRGFFSGGIYTYAYSAPFDVSGNTVFGGDSWSNGIYVYAPYAAYGWIRDNTVNDVGGNGIRLYAYSTSPTCEITNNTVSDSGTSWDYGFYIYSPGSTTRGNVCLRQIGVGFYFNDGNCEIDGNTAQDCTRAGFGVSGSNCTVTNNTGTGSEGEGFANWGGSTIFTGNTFLGNRLDVANGGSFITPNIQNVNTFETGGASTYPQVWGD
jgi:parallel beta-helix repeat protein